MPIFAPFFNQVGYAFLKDNSLFTRWIRDKRRGLTRICITFSTEYRVNLNIGYEGLISKI